MVIVELEMMYLASVELEMMYVASVEWEMVYRWLVSSWR